LDLAQEGIRMPIAVAQGPLPKKPTLFEAGDVAKALGLSYAMVYALTRAGRLVPAFVTPRGLKLYYPESIEDLVAERALKRAKGETRARG
jgi:hypothetical protein